MTTASTVAIPIEQLSLAVRRLERVLGAENFTEASAAAQQAELWAGEVKVAVQAQIAALKAGSPCR